MAGRGRSILALCLLTSCIISASSATGSETLDYTYDARGRLIKVSRSGSVNNGISACYTYDKADNRSGVTVNTPGDCSSPPPGFSVNDVVVTEGGSLSFTVAKSGTTGSSYSINYASANGTASAGSDYAAVSGTLTFAAAEATKTITIATTDDAAIESAETVLVNLSGATGGATISDVQGVGTINDNDTTGPSFSINDRTAQEGTSMTFTVTKTGTTTATLTINYATADGSASSVFPIDYQPASGTLTFGPNDVTKTITITLGGGQAFENDEQFYVNLSGASGGATIADAQGVGTIWDDDDECGPVGCNLQSEPPPAESE